MNILLLANKVPYPPKDGGAFATLNMALGLHYAGAKVTILAMCTPKHNTPNKDFPDWLQRKVNITTVFVDTTISPISAAFNLVFSRYPYNAQRFRNKKFKDLVHKRLKEEQFDIVQLEGPYLEPYIKTIRKLHRGSIVLRAHNVEWEIWERSSAAQINILRRWYFSILSRRIKRLESRVLRSVDMLVPISQRDSENLYKMGFKGISYTCPTGYSIEVNSNDNESFEFPSLFHIGGLDWIPNQEGIIWFLENCWPTIKSLFTKVKFYIAGRNAPPDFVDKLYVYPGVVFCGEVENSADFISSKAVMVVPLLSGSGMRIKIVEGLALGKAIVSTSIGAEGIDVESGKHIAIADSAEQFSHKVIELLKDKQLVVEMGRNAKRFASENLDNNLFTKGLFEFFNENIKNPIPLP